MEQLTKQQIVLLCLLVCFVSSIATGTVIISLSDQATPQVSQTVNHVIERVVEKATSTGTPQATKETVIVKDDQAVVDAIAGVSKSVVRITGVPIGSAVARFVGLGVIVSSSGRAVAALGGNDPRNMTLSAELAGGNIVAISYVSTDSVTGLSLFQADQSSDPQNARAYTAATLGDSDSLKLGQAVVAISGETDPSVGTGIVSSLLQKTVSSPDKGGVGKIVAALVPTNGFDSQSILANLLGEVVGIGSGSFIPSNFIKTYATP